MVYIQNSTRTPALSGLGSFAPGSLYVPVPGLPGGPAVTQQPAKTAGGFQFPSVESILGTVSSVFSFMTASATQGSQTAAQYVEAQRLAAERQAASGTRNMLILGGAGLVTAGILFFALKD